VYFGNFEETVSAARNCGGDADTTAAIVGVLAGAVTGERGIPADWLKSLCEWPRGVNVMREIADRLVRKNQEPSAGSPVRYFWPGLLPRNIFQLVAVILHGFRRLAPPY
jgi:ADP-ribosyl-[dinitrogen reductase] hydrolase